MSSNREGQYKYSSLSLSPFDIWRIFLFGMPFTFILFIFFGLALIYSLIFSILICLIIMAMLAYFSYIEVERYGHEIIIQNNNSIIRIKGIKSIETWWQYDIGMSSNVISWGDKSQTRAHSNKIYVIAEIQSDQSPIQLYEQINMSSKFPNNHKYRSDKSIRKDRLFKINDIDKCFHKLKLDDFLHNVTKH